MRKIPRPFKMPWGGGMVVEEVIVSKYHEPTIQLLQFDSGDKVIRFCWKVQVPIGLMRKILKAKQISKLSE